MASRSSLFPPSAPLETTKFWRDPNLGNMELLRATFVTHAFTRHSHEEYAIGVIDSGVEEFNYQGETHRATANDIVIVHPGEVHTGQAGVPLGWQYRMFYPDVTLLQQTLAELDETLHSMPYFPQPVIQDPELADRLRKLHIALEQAESRLECETRFLSTFAKLITRHADQRPWIRPNGQEDRAVQQSLEYLNTHYAHSISLEQLATLTNLKPLRLLRSFQRSIGLPPHAYLIQLRVTRAKALLKQGLSIAEVACDTGFTDQSHLNRHFKRMMGITPKQYQQTGVKVASTVP